MAAAVLVKLPELFGVEMNKAESFYARNASFFVLPLLTCYFVWKRRLTTSTVRWLAVAFLAAGVFANVYPFTPGGRGHTEVLTVLHLPTALWLIVGIACAGGRWSQVAGRMDFIRFSGELFIYYVLIALGGGVFMAFMGMLFQAIGIDAEPFFELVAPCGAAGALLVASWLVEAKQSVIENMAPVLTRLFTPLFAALLRISEFGFTPNRGAALGENAILLVNLASSTVLYVRFLTGRGSFTSLEQGQTSYVPVYAAWAAIVVIVFPPVFKFI